MMVDLLAGHTSMTVLQATQGMPLARDHIHVIPPGTYLSIRDGAIHLSKPQAHNGARLPFDFLLRSMAGECGPRAICVILSGTLAGLTARQREVMALVIAGQPSKVIAADLGISRRTVENHRASIMRTTGAMSLPELARLALAADPECSARRCVVLTTGAAPGGVTSQ